MRTLIGGPFDGQDMESDVDTMIMPMWHRNGDYSIHTYKWDGEAMRHRSCEGVSKQNIEALFDELLGGSGEPCN